MKKILKRLIILIIIVLIILIALDTVNKKEIEISPNPNYVPNNVSLDDYDTGEINSENIFVVDDKIYYVEGTDLYDGEGSFIRSIRQDSWTDPIFQKRGEQVYAIDPKTGAERRMYRNLEEDFESTKTFIDLFIADDTKWNSFTPQSPKANSVNDYVQLRKDIFAGGDWIQNYAEISSERAHSGKQSLKMFAIDGRGGVSKMSIDKENVYFEKGDDVWFSGWYFFEKGIPTTFFDMEYRAIEQSPGPRVIIRGDKFIDTELKFADKPSYGGRVVEIPTGEWFNLKVHWKLSQLEDEGLIEMWINDELTFRGNGRTLPTNDSILHSIQTGITATSEETILYVDDIRLSNKPF